MPAPNFGGAAAPVVMVDDVGVYVKAPTTNQDGSRSTRAVGGPTIATGQVAVTTAATQIVPARAGRGRVVLSSTSAVVFYVGAAGVTASNGLYVAAAAGASVTLHTSAAVFAIGAANVTISYLEDY